MGTTIVAGGLGLDPALTQALAAAGAGPEASLGSGGGPAEPVGSVHSGVARDMQTASLAHVAAERGLRLAATLVVVEAGSLHLEDDALDDRCERLGGIVAGVLATLRAASRQPQAELELDGRASSRR